MSITSGVVLAMETAMKQAMGDLLAPQDVDVYGEGRVQVRLHVSSKRANEADLTGGAVQDTNLVATIDADDWDAKVTRPPQKGDVIWWVGRRHAVDRAIVAVAGGNSLFYKCVLQG